MLNERIDHLLTRRLFNAYAWRDCLYRGLGRRSFMSVPVVTDFVDEVERLNDFEEGMRAWNLGRVRYFIELIEAGKTLDPICIDNYCRNGHVYPEPIIVDGHHRMIAAKVTKLERLPSSYSGRTDLLAYLKGERRTRPRS